MILCVDYFLFYCNFIAGLARPNNKSNIAWSSKICMNVGAVFQVAGTLTDVWFIFRAKNYEETSCKSGVHCRIVGVAFAEEGTLIVNVCTCRWVGARWVLGNYMAREWLVCFYQWREFLFLRSIYSNAGSCASLSCIEKGISLYAICIYIMWWLCLGTGLCGDKPG